MKVIVSQLVSSWHGEYLDNKQRVKIKRFGPGEVVEALDTERTRRALERGYVNPVEEGGTVDG